MTDQERPPWANEYAFAVAKVAQVSAWHHVAQENLAAIIEADTTVLQSIAREVLSKEKKETDGSPFPREVERLAEALQMSLAGLYERLGMNSPGWPGRSTDAPDAIPDWVWREGMLGLDAHAADLLQGIGRAGENAATQLRQRSAARAMDFRGDQLRLRFPGSPPGLPDVRTHDAAQDTSQYPPKLFMLWAGSPPPIAKALALVLWRDQVEAQLRAEKEQQLPALSFLVDEALSRVMTTAGRVEQGVLVDRRGNKITEMSRPDDPLDLPALDMARAEALIIKGGERLGSLTSHRLMRWEVRTGHAQAIMGAADPRRISVVGGWEELAKRIGAGGGGKTTDDVRAILHAQAHLCFTIGSKKRGNLISYTFEEESRIRRAEIAIVLGDPLLPHFVVTEMRKSNSRKMREGRRLVPIVELPPFVGRPNDYGAQASLQARIVAEMRKRAAELFEAGGVLLDMDDLSKIAASVELPHSLLPRVLDRWRQDGDDGPAFLELVDRDRYSLARAHAPAREFLIQSGRNEVTGAKGGRRSVAARRRQYDRSKPSS